MVFNMSLFSEAATSPVLYLHNPAAQPAEHTLLLFLAEFILKNLRCAHWIWSPGKAITSRRELALDN